MAGGGEHGGSKAIIAAFFANLGIAVAKFVAFAVTGSASMLAESIHSVADSGNQGLLLLGGKRAKRSASTSHEFGYGGERYFWAFVVAVVLFTVGAAFAMYEGIEKIRHPHELESIGWAIGVLIFAIVLETFSFRTAIVETNKVRGDDSMWDFVRHSKSPELPVVLLEDAAALAGLLLALTAVVVASVTDEPVWDGVGTLSIGVLLAVVATILAREMKSLLLGEAATPASRAAIIEAIESHPAADRLIHLRTRHLGPDELLVAAKVQFGSHFESEDMSQAIDEIEAAIRTRVREANVIFIEPDVFHTPGVAEPAAD